MATPKGNFAAYNQLRPSPNYFGEALRDVHAMRKQRELQNKLEAEKRAAKQKALQEKSEKYREDIWMDFRHSTPNNDLNTLITKGLNEVKDRYYELAKIANPTNKSTTSEEKLEARIKMKDLATYPEKLKTMTAGVTRWYQDQAAGLQDGSLIETPKATALLDTIYDLGSNNRFATVALGANDELIFGYEGEDGELASITMQDVLKGKLPTLRKSFDWQTSTKGAGELVGLHTAQVENGDTTIKTKGVTGRSRAALNQYANELFSLSEDGEVSDPLYNVWTRDMGRDIGDLTAQDVQDIRNRYVQAAINTKDTLYSRTQDEPKEGEDDGQGTGLTMKVDKNTGTPVFESYTTGEGNNATNHSIIQFTPRDTKPIKISGEDDQQLFITSVGMDRETGQLVADYYRIKTEPGGEIITENGLLKKEAKDKAERITNGYLPGDGLHRLAVSMGFENVYELKNNMENQYLESTDGETENNQEQPLFN